MLLTCFWLLSGAVFAQTLTVRGEVVQEENGEPIIGASVMVKGTNIGGVTDINGKFVVTNIPQNAKLLRVSYIGAVAKEVPLSKEFMKISLKSDAQNLDEVMVVAFGKQKKSSFTGSATVINSKELSKHVTTNVTNALVGSTPGLQIRGTSGSPGSVGDIKVRGISSMYAGTGPLIIVDGAPYASSLSNIPQDDIENITVLKDAASAALYGARGASGVIIVTTKKGKTTDAIVNVDMKWGVNTKGVQDYRTIQDPRKYYEVAYAQFYDRYFFDDGLSAEAANRKANDVMLNALGYNIFDYPQDEMLIGLDGKMNPKAVMGRRLTAEDGTVYWLQRDDFAKEAYRKGLRQEYNINVSGRMGHSGSFYGSLGYLDDQGFVVYSGFKRFSGRLKADYQAKKWLKLAANVAYTRSDRKSNPNFGSESLGNMMYFVSMSAPIYPLYVRIIGPDGKPHIATDANGNPHYDYGVGGRDFPGISRNFSSKYNPIGTNRYNVNTSYTNQLNANMTADVNFTDFLKLSLSSTLIWGAEYSSVYENSLYGDKVSVNGRLDKGYSYSYRQNHVQTLTYNDKFDKHNITAMLGHEYYINNGTALWAYAQGLFSPAILELDAAAKKLDSGSNSSIYNVEGFFGSMQYNYDDKYFASASYRRDASSRFANDHMWGNFWSIGAAWLINKESFFKADFVDQLKFKLSVGQQGNDNIRSYAYIDTYSLKPSSDTTMSADFAVKGNNRVTWETTTNFNAGLEFNLFGGRLNGTLDVYNKKTTDLLFWVSIPESSGTRGYYDNIGDIRNTGVELSLQGTIIKTKDFNWDLNFNVAHNQDKILKLPESKIKQLGGFYSGFMWYKIGGPLYNYALPEYAGPNAQGEATYWMDDSMKGITNRPGKRHDSVTTNPNEATIYEQGSNLPKAFGGFGSSISAYGFDLNLTFDYQWGGKLYDYRYMSLMGNISSPSDVGVAIHEDVLKSWTYNNTSTSIPRARLNDTYTVARSARGLTDASYLNFQSFTVGYTIPARLTKRISLSKIRVYAVGENLWIWSARQGLDPRLSYGSTSRTTGYVASRTFMGGLQVTF